MLSSEDILGGLGAKALSFSHTRQVPLRAKTQYAQHVAPSLVLAAVPRFEPVWVLTPDGCYVLLVLQTSRGSVSSALAGRGIVTCGRNKLFRRTPAIPRDTPPCPNRGAEEV